MIGDARLLPKLYRQMAQDEKHFKEIADGAQDAQNTEELGLLFTQMTQSSLNLATKTTLASTWQTFEHETVKFVLTNSS